jgi:hypothetical protein
MSTQEITPPRNLQILSTTYKKGQYSLWQILNEIIGVKMQKKAG